MKRKISWVVAALAYTVPPVWAYYMVQADVEAQRQSHGFICGNPILLSAVAVSLGIWAYFDKSAARYKGQFLELFVFSVPLFVGATFLMPLLVGASPWFL